MDHTQIENQVAKVAAAWSLIGITSWANFASFMAGIYTLLLATEWMWKKAVRPLLIHFGVIAAPEQKEADNAAK